MPFFVHFFVSTGVISRIEAYVGGVGWREGDLLRLARKFVERFEGRYVVDDETRFKAVFSLAKNGLSMALASLDYFAPGEILWSRVTQLILLDNRADLLGALLDFDLSVVTCAYDGTTVRITPRAAHSLQTMSLTVTPFTMEEKRNHCRIVKYFKRGFRPFLIDPNCRRADPCTDSCITRIGGGPQEDRLRGGRYFFRRLMNEDVINNIYAAQRNSNGVLVCSDSCPSNPYPPFPFRRTAGMSKLYSVKIVEPLEGDAIVFLSKYKNWSKEWWERVEKVPAELQMCCTGCREAYGLYLFLKEEAPPECGSVDELLLGPKALMLTGRSTPFKPSFYSGGAFDSSKVRGNARTVYEQVNVLKAQYVLDVFRYMISHDMSCNGYQQRFSWGDDLETVLRSASRVSFRESTRAPVGLNPERFIAVCEGCGKWLCGCEYGVRLCDECSEQKPAAADS